MKYICDVCGYEYDEALCVNLPRAVRMIKRHPSLKKKAGKPCSPRFSILSRGKPPQLVVMM